MPREQVRFAFAAGSARERASGHMSAVHAAAARTFTGYGSVFHTLIDSQVPTRILPGAFAKTLAGDRSRIKILWQHDETQPIGRPLELKEDGRGLWLKAQLADTALGREVWQLMKDGVITELSIGFDVIDWTMTREPALNDTVRHINQLALWEVSPVTFAANAEARIDSVHRRRPGGGGSVMAQVRDLELQAIEHGLDVPARQGAR